MTTAVLSQASFRARKDQASVDTDPTSANWIAAADTNFTWQTDVCFRIRFLVQETAGGNPNAAGVKLQYNKNGAGANDVTTSSSNVIGFANASISAEDTAVTVARLGGTGTFVNGRYSNDGSPTSTADLPASGNTEWEFGIQIKGSDVANGDTITLNLVALSGTAIGLTKTPTVTVMKTAVDTKSWWGDLSANPRTRPPSASATARDWEQPFQEGYLFSKGNTPRDIWSHIHDLPQRVAKPKPGYNDQPFITLSSSAGATTAAAVFEAVGDTVVNSVLLYDPAAGPVKQPPADPVYTALSASDQALPKRKPVVGDQDALVVQPAITLAPLFSSEQTLPKFKARQYHHDAIVLQPPSQATATPSILAGLVSDQPIYSSTKYGRKTLSEAFLWDPQTVSTISSKIAFEDDSPTIVNSILLYDHMAGPVKQPPADPVPLKDFVPSDVSIGKKGAKPYDQAVALVLRPAAQPAGFSLTVADVSLQKAAKRQLDNAGFITAPTTATVTPSSFGYQSADQPASAKRPLKQYPLSSFVFAIPIDDYGFVISDQTLPKKGPRQSDTISFVTVPPTATATPSVYGYQVSDQHYSATKYAKKILSEAFIWAPQSISTISSTVAFENDSPTVINSTLVYDQIAGPVSPPTAVVTLPTSYFDLTPSQVGLTKGRRFLDNAGFVTAPTAAVTLPTTYFDLTPADVALQKGRAKHLDQPSLARAPSTQALVDLSVTDISRAPKDGARRQADNAGSVFAPFVQTTVDLSVADVGRVQRALARREQDSQGFIGQPVPPTATPTNYGYQISDLVTKRVAVKPQLLPYGDVVGPVVPPPPDPTPVATDQYLIGGPDITEQFVTHGHISAGGISYTLNPLSRRTV